MPTFPYPPDIGSRIDIWGRIKFFLERSCDICLIVGMDQGEVAKDMLADVRHLGIQVHFIKISIWKSTADLSICKKVQVVINEFLPDIILCEYHRFAAIISAIDLKEAEVWYRSHNFELLHHLEKVFNQVCTEWTIVNFLSKMPKWVYGVFLQSYRNYCLEMKMHRIADRIFYISTSDMQAMRLLYGHCSKAEWIVPFMNISDVKIKTVGKRIEVVYLGSNFKNNVNRDGANRLINKIIPKIEEKLPNIFHFNVVGKHSQQFYSEANSKTVSVYEYIPDLDEFLQGMDIACYPIKIGWGLKLKVLQAFTSGLPVVGYPQTFRGLAGKSNSFYPCRCISEFVAAFSELIDPETRESVAKKARAEYAEWKIQSELHLEKYFESCKKK